MTGYTKLFNSLLTSDIWCQDSDTKVVWITMLAMADHNGMVEATAPALAKMAGVSVEKTKEVLDMLEKLDPVSRSLDNGGRRIERVNGGYTLLNYKKYRLKDRAYTRKEYMRKYMRDYMAERRKVAKVKPVLDSVSSVKPIAEADITYTLVPKGGVLGGENGRSINSPSKENQKPKTKNLRTCPIPECYNPVPVGDIYCCQLHKDYAERLLAKQNRGAS